MGCTAPPCTPGALSTASTSNPFAEKKNYRCVPSLQQFYSGGPVAVAGNGELLACACDGDVKLVAPSQDAVFASSGVILGTLECDDKGVTAIAFGGAGLGSLLFTAGHSRLIRVWDVESRKCIRSWKGHDGPVMAMVCHSTGGLLATAGADRKVLVWDVDGGFCTHFFKGHTAVVSSIMFHNNPKRLLLFSGSEDGTVRVWNLENKKCISVLNKHFSTVTSLALSRDGKTLLSAGRDKVVNIWDACNYSLKTTVPVYEMVEAVLIIHPKSSFLTGLGSHEPQNANPDVENTIFFTVGERGIIRLWSSGRAVCLFEQRISDVTSFPDDEESRRGFISAFLLPEDRGLLCVTADQQFLYYSRTRSCEEPYNLNLDKRLIGYNEEILDLKFLGEDENYLAVATNLEQVRVYRLPTMSCSFVLSGHSKMVLCIDACVSSSGRSLVVTGSNDNCVRLWDVEERCCLATGEGHLEAVGSVSFSRKWKNFFVSGSRDRTIKVWNFDDSAVEVSMKAKSTVAAHDKDINSLAVSPNDALVCSGSEDHTACIWKLPDLVSSVVLRGHRRGIWSVEFSPVEQWVITSSGDKTIKLWAVSDGSCLKTFEGHTSGVLQASFLSRGTQFISCGSDGLLKLWNIKTNECVATFDKHEGKIWALAVGRRTEMLATGGTDAVVNLWYDCTMEDKLEDLKREETEAVKGQELDNAVTDSQYSKAIQLAFELRKPKKLFDIFALISRKGDVDGLVKKALASLNKEELCLLFEYIRQWNTKPKSCHVAQFVLFQTLNIFPPTDILEIKGIGELLEGIIPYSQRHFSRIDRVARSTFLLDYVLTRMSVVDPDSSIDNTISKKHLLAVTNVESVDHNNEDSGITNESTQGDSGSDQPHAILSEDVNQQQVNLTEEAVDASSKKRKSVKAKKGSKKKAKVACHVSV